MAVNLTHFRPDGKTPVVNPRNLKDTNVFHDKDAVVNNGQPFSYTNRSEDSCCVKLQKFILSFFQSKQV